jgi:Skp family chaperone for outer membrane proteins
MNNYTRYYTPLFIILLLSLPSFLLAQTSKTGYINMQSIYEKWPEYKQAQMEIQNLRATKKAEIEKEGKRIEEKRAAFYKQSPSTITAEVVNKLKAETDGLETFSSQKEGEVSSTRQVLYIALEGKLKEAIRKAAVEKGYSGVVDISTVIYYDSKEEITKLVLKNLGVLID